MSELNFESVNAKIEALDIAELEVGAKVAKEDRGGLIEFICKIWKAVGDIVRLIAKIPFIPKKWRNVLRIFIETMDSICPE